MSAVLSVRTNSTIIRVIAGLRHIATDQGLAAMNDSGVPFYQRDGVLVRICPVQAKASDGSIVYVPAVQNVTLSMLHRALGQSAVWEKLNARGKVIRTDPPKEISEQIIGMADEWPFPPLFGVIGTQTMRPDGSLLTREGYDPATGLVLFNPPPMPPIPDQPTKQDAQAALAILDELLAEFPFKDETETNKQSANRSVALSMLMTPILRGALAPAVPLHVVTAPEAGTGKSYLQDISSCMALGERCAVLCLGGDPAETDKRLIGAALDQRPIIAIDNVTELLASDLLCQIVERPLLQIRPLGTSNLTRIPNASTTFANGNNMAVAADMVRRTVQCAMDANMESPEEREFKSDPIAMVLADRGKFVAACLTIGRAYVLAGKPGRKPQRPSYAGWSDIVRSSLCWLGCPDPSDTVKTVRADDPIRQARTALFTAWLDRLQPEIGYRTGELIRKAEAYIPQSDDRENPDLWDALFAIAGPRNGTKNIDPDKLGNWLRDNKNKVAQGYKLTADTTDAARPRWKLTKA